MLNIWLSFFLIGTTYIICNSKRIQWVQDELILDSYSVRKICLPDTKKLSTSITNPYSKLLRSLEKAETDSGPRFFCSSPIYYYLNFKSTDKYGQGMRKQEDLIKMCIDGNWL